MEENKQIKVREIGITIFLTGLILLFLFQIEDPYRVGLLLAAGTLFLLRPLPFPKWSLLDKCLIAISLFDILSCCYAACPIPALNTAFISVYMLTVYFICRRFFISEQIFPLFRLSSLIPIGIALILAVCSFFVFRNSVLNAGFEDTYHFRFLFRPLGYITNIWAEVLLMLSGWICLMRRWSILLQFLCITAILFSFSRGAYLALSVYLLFALLFFPKAEKRRLLLPAGIAILLTVILLPKEFHTTLKINQTVSQQRSTKSRINSSEAAWSTFQKHPLLGYGNNNYTYAVDPLIGQDSTKPFTSIAPSLPVQLLVEKGIAGMLLYLLMGVIIVRILWQHRKDPDCRIIAATLTAVFFKDLTQATWLNTPFLLLTFYILLAYLQRKDIKICKINKMANLIPAMGLIAFIGWNIPQLTGFIDSTENDLQQGNYLKAYNRHPEDVQLRYLYAESIRTEHPAEADSLLQNLTACYPKNSLYLSAYAWELYQQNDTANAVRMMSEAIRYTPRLVEGETMQLWKKQDSSFYKQVLKTIASFQPTQDATPADYARYGYLAHTLGNMEQSAEYLQQAIHALPNLATPWLLLQDTTKYRLLLYGAFQQNPSNNKLPKKPIITPIQLLEMSYGHKVQSWYGKSPADKDSIFHYSNCSFLFHPNY